MKQLPNPLDGDKIDIKLKPKNILSNIIRVPKFISDRFVDGTPESKATLPKLANINTVFGNIYKQFKKHLTLIKQNENLINDNKEAIDRNKLEIDKKNNKINFLSFSESFVENPDFANPILKRTILENETGQIEGIIFDEDSGLESSVITEANKNYLKLNIDENLLKSLQFSSTGSVKIAWDETSQTYKIEQADTLIYTSQNPEKEIILDHNLHSRAIDVKVFKILENDVDLKYPIVPGIEYPSDNQIRIYLTEAQRIQVLITRL